MVVNLERARERYRARAGQTAVEIHLEAGRRSASVALKTQFPSGPIRRCTWEKIGRTKDNAGHLGVK